MSYSVDIFQGLVTGKDGFPLFHIEESSHESAIHTFFLEEYTKLDLRTNFLIVQRDYILQSNDYERIVNTLGASFINELNRSIRQLVDEIQDLLIMRNAYLEQKAEKKLAMS